MESNRRSFLKKVSAGTAGILATGATSGMTAKSYGRIVGANDRMGVAIVGLGRRLGAFVEPIVLKESNVELIYLCDVMKSQRDRAAERFARVLDYKPKLENDLRVVFQDSKVDAISVVSIKKC